MHAKCLKLALTVAGTVIGAGFATGKELLLFFPNEPSALCYLFLSVLLMGTVSLLYFGQRKTENPLMSEGSFIKLLFLLFSGASCAVMFACGGETLWETTGLPFPVGVILTFAITLCIVRFGAKNVYRFNLIATPILLVCMIGISLAGLLAPVSLLPHAKGATLNLLVYSGYNLLSVLPVLGALSDTVTKKEGYLGIAGGFITVAAVGLLLKIFLIRFHNLTNESAIPVLTVISTLHNHLETLYTVMLYLSVLTTAINGFYAVTKNQKTLPVGLLLLCCSFLGFSALVENLYPFFGYVGIAVTGAFIIKEFYKKSKKGF